MPDDTYERGYAEFSDWETGLYEVLLLAGTPVFDVKHPTVGDLLADNTEAEGTGYARKSVPNPVLTKTGVSSTLDHGDIVYTALDVGTFEAVVYYRVGESDGASPLLFFKDVSVGTTGVDVTVATDGAGLATVVFEPLNRILTVNEYATIGRNRIQYANLNVWSTTHTALVVT